MSTSFKTVVCRPGDTLFVEVLRTIYPADVAPQADGGAEEDYLVQCLVLLDKKEVIGRLAVYGNAVLTHLGKPTAQFGAFECINDVVAAKVLLEAGFRIAREAGAVAVIGPMNGTTWNQYRFISESGGPPRFFTEHAHPAYYPALWQEAGFSPFQQYVSNIAPVPESDAGESHFFGRNGLTVRNIDVAHLQQELENVYPICMAAFRYSPLFSSISKEKFVSKLAPLKRFLSGGLTKIVSDQKGGSVAFALCLPDILDPSRKTLVLKTAAKHPDCPIPAVMPELYRLTMAEARALGYERVIHAFMHVDNKSLLRSRQFEGSSSRRYTLYIRPF